MAVPEEKDLAVAARHAAQPRGAGPGGPRRMPQLRRTEAPASRLQPLRLLRRARGGRRREGAEGRGSGLTSATAAWPHAPLTATFTLAVDAMGGDHAPEHGRRRSGDRRRTPPRRALPAGRRRGRSLRPCCGGATRAAGRLHHPPRPRGHRQRHEADGRAAHARLLHAPRDRRGRRGEASGVVSAGNTGALLALAKIVIKTLPGHRPAGHGRDRPLGARRRGAARPRRQRAVRRAQPGRIRRHGRRVRPHRARPDRALDRPAECRLGGAEGRRHAAPGGETSARQPHRPAVPSASSKATTSPPAPPTWSSPTASPATSR